MRTPKDYGVAFLLQLVMAKKINPIMIFINSFCRQYRWSVSIVNLFPLLGDAMVGAGLCFCSIYPGKTHRVISAFAPFFSSDRRSWPGKSQDSDDRRLLDKKSLISLMSSLHFRYIIGIVRFVWLLNHSFFYN